MAANTRRQREQKAELAALQARARAAEAARPRRYYIVKNLHGFPCGRCRRRFGGKRVAHEYYTVDCRPVLFERPEDWYFIQRKLATDSPGLDLSGVAFGTPEEITAAQARLLSAVVLRPNRPFNWQAELRKLNKGRV